MASDCWEETQRRLSPLHLLTPQPQKRWGLGHLLLWLARGFCGGGRRVRGLLVLGLAVLQSLLACGTCAGGTARRGPGALSAGV